MNLFVPRDNIHRTKHVRTFLEENLIHETLLAECVIAKPSARDQDLPDALSRMLTFCTADKVRFECARLRSSQINSEVLDDGHEEKLIEILQHWHEKGKLIVEAHKNKWKLLDFKQILVKSLKCK